MKATLTIEDEGDNRVSVVLELDPPLEPDSSDPLTPAGSLASDIIRFLAEKMEPTDPPDPARN